MIDKQEAAMSREAGSATTWGVEANYEIVNGVLRPVRANGESERLYFPMAHTELPNVIAKLNAYNSSDLIQFAENYGNLGHYALVKPEDRQGGDPVGWIEAHVNTVRLVTDLISCIQEWDEEKATRILEGMEVEGDEGPDIPTSIIGNSGKVSLTRWALGQASEGTALELANRVVRDILNKNIKGIQRKAYKVENHQIKSFFAFSALIEVVYWQILNTAEKGAFKRCQFCGTPFISTDGRQKFCPGFNKGESRCAVLHRQRKRRQKQKGEK
ncbi:MAG TPA: hypothetical protein VFT51_03960 [Bacillales bacterium]|nr:hypothetical protein [Bacillales bacterium]